MFVIFCVLGDLVLTKIASVGERDRTERTFEGFYPTMKSKMSCQMSVLDKLLAADRALVRTFTSMGTHVSAKVAGMSETDSTFLTSKWTLLIMLHAYMGRQGSGRFVTTFADMALKGFDVRMSALMLLHSGPLIECFPAYFTLVWFFNGVCSHVLF